MVGEDTVRMSVTELKRVHVIRQAMGKALRQREAGEVLGLTTRQVRRLIQRVQAEGDVGLVHRGRGQPSNRRHAPALKGRVRRLYAKHYSDFGPTLAGRRSWRSAMGSRSVPRPCGSGFGSAGSSISRGGSGRTGHGGPGRPMGGNSSNWTARTMIGWRGAGPGVG